MSLCVPTRHQAECPDRSSTTAFVPIRSSSWQSSLISFNPTVTRVEFGRRQSGGPHESFNRDEKTSRWLLENFPSNVGRRSRQEPMSHYYGLPLRFGTRKSENPAFRRLQSLCNHATRLTPYFPVLCMQFLRCMSLNASFATAMGMPCTRNIHQLGRNVCGYVDGANIWDRKSPKCQRGKLGLRLFNEARETTAIGGHVRVPDHRENAGELS
jgi:hypothetical protein